jgi:hypothetical protein
MDAVAEFVGAMSKAWGQQFTPHFSVLFGSLQKYFKVENLSPHPLNLAGTRGFPFFEGASRARWARDGARETEMN